MINFSLSLYGITRRKCPSVIKPGVSPRAIDIALLQSSNAIKKHILKCCQVEEFQFEARRSRNK